MSALELSNINNNMQFNSCDLPLVLEENTNKKYNGCCLNVIREKKLYEIIDLLKDYPVCFNIKDDVLIVKFVKF